MSGYISVESLVDAKEAKELRGSVICQCTASPWLLTAETGHGGKGFWWKSWLVGRWHWIDL